MIQDIFPVTRDNPLPGAYLYPHLFWRCVYRKLRLEAQFRAYYTSNGINYCVKYFYWRLKLQDTEFARDTGTFYAVEVTRKLIVLVKL